MHVDFFFVWAIVSKVKSSNVVSCFLLHVMLYHVLLWTSRTHNMKTWVDLGCLRLGRYLRSSFLCCFFHVNMAWVSRLWFLFFSSSSLVYILSSSHRAKEKKGTREMETLKNSSSLSLLFGAPFQTKIRLVWAIRNSPKIIRHEDSSVKRWKY